MEHTPRDGSVTRTGLLPGRPSDAWTYALLGGLASLPLTTFGYWLSGSELSVSPVILGGVLAGSLATRKTGARGTVGLRAGLVGTLPALWMLVDVLRAASALAGPLWFRAVALPVAVGTVLGAALVFGAVAGELGAAVGGWLARRSGRSESSAVGG
jgi:hypothetical protein